MILVAGENLIDLVPSGETDEGAPAFAALPGGSPYNCARALARLGVPVGYLTPISTDPMGELLAAALQAEGARLLGGRSPRPAALALVGTAGGQPHYRFYREGTADRDISAEGLRRAMPSAATALHLGSMALMEGPDAEVLADAFVEVAGRGLATSLDPNIRAGLLPPCGARDYRARLARMFDAARLVKLSDEDLSWWAPGAGLEPAAEALMRAHAPALLVVTMGAEGAVAIRGATRLRIPAATVARLVDTVGAGDSFMAALLAGLHDVGALAPGAMESLPEEALSTILARAACAAAITCVRRGCVPPSRAELDGGG